MPRGGEQIRHFDSFQKKAVKKGCKKKSWHLSHFDNFSGFVAFQSFMIIWVAFQTFAVKSLDESSDNTQLDTDALT